MTRGRVYHLPGKVPGVAVCGKRYGSRASRATADREDVTCPKCKRHSEADPVRGFGHADATLEYLSYLNGLHRGRYSPTVKPLERKTHRWLLRNKSILSATAIALGSGVPVSEAKRRLTNLLNAGVVSLVTGRGFAAIDYKTKGG